MKCPDCGRDVSQRATVCVGCGAPLTQKRSNDRSETNKYIGDYVLAQPVERLIAHCFDLLFGFIFILLPIMMIAGIILLASYITFLWINIYDATAQMIDIFSSLILLFTIFIPLIILSIIKKIIQKDVDVKMVSKKYIIINIIIVAILSILIIIANHSVFGFIRLAIFIINCLYYYFVLISISINYWKQGTSFGKKRRNLYVLNKDTGEKLSLGYMFLRETVGKYISGLILSLGWIWVLIDKQHQGWHDKLVGSVVVKHK
jgi:uncharacterized RDD family membrane protein YckC